MLALIIALLATIILTPETLAKGDDYTVWASVIFSRGGERTPEVLGDLPKALTSLGAHQVYDSGSFFRERYITSNLDIISDINDAPLQGLSAYSVNPLQLYVAALDEQWTVASAEAFMQGLYPPYELNESLALTLDPTSMDSNGSYIPYPLDGYQYVHIHASGALDPEFPYLGGSLDCPAFDVQALDYTNTPQFLGTQATSKRIYEAVGGPLLDEVLDEDGWDYFNAYGIYDYVNYRAAHNMSVAALLEQPQYISRASDRSYQDELRWYADQQQFAQLGNLTVANDYASDMPVWPAVTTGSISTIAGNMLAAKLLGQLQLAVDHEGEYYKLSVLFGDFEPLMSFFALNALPERNANFYGLPDFGSVAVVELFSRTSGASDLPFPSMHDLWVRFYFRNGTGGKEDSENGDFRSYPLFSRGPSKTDMSWNDFQSGMCQQCGATNVFCAEWNTSLATTESNRATSNSNPGQTHLTPAAAGAVGAVVTLGVAALIFAAVMLFGGVRLHRVSRSHKSELGGFKGSQKLASDKDLTLPKGGAVVGASVVRAGDTPITPLGHERVGSWEMKQTEAGHVESETMQRSRRSSMMGGEERVDPFQDPVRAEEHV